MSDYILSVVIILLVVFIFILLRSRSSIKKNRSFDNTKVLNPTLIAEKQSEKREIKQKQKQKQLEQLPIKVNKIDVIPQELKYKNKLSLPSSTMPVISEVVTAFYPTIRDGDKLKIVFTPEMMEKFKNGTAKVMQTKDGTGYRSMAISAQGSPKILEHAKIIKEIDPALVLNASFQLASVVVAQQHMQQINQRLKQIKYQLDELKKLHMKDYLSHAQGNINYFEVRVIPHFRENGKFDDVIRNQGEDRFNKTIDILLNMLSLQKDSLNKLTNIKNGVFFGKLFGEEEFIKEAKRTLEEYNDIQEIINLYFKWLKEMYIPFLYACGYSEGEIQAVVFKISEFENENNNSHKAIHQRVTEWSDSFSVKAFRFKEKEYIEKSTKSVKAVLPAPLTNFKAPTIVDGVNKPLEMIVEYSDRQEMKTYLTV
ncbi:hypothetical protein L2D08_07550 [Domibacillus sp. PGB-M46]|uniref:hypothetical protein n=1 Tax=Domibacillus sp. PGB-M46 TaxID=2910255 RepID=UPI001F5A6E74|nr:hypothetical protein [Domibacillus sp. PGB-M46]MCI2254215.1 hypothetical protein [Domibacillus sp. PGB-M46]